MSSSDSLQSNEYETMIVQGVPTKVKICSIKNIPMLFLKNLMGKMLVAAQFNRDSKQLKLKKILNQKKQNKQNGQTIHRFKRIKKNKDQKWMSKKMNGSGLYEGNQ